MVDEIDCNLRTSIVDAIPSIQMTPNYSPQDQALRDVAEKLEASFLAEMLKSAGLGTGRTEFGGGAGEDQFSSFLVQEQALAMVRAGGIGLSESIFESLKETENASKNS